ncbi:hypothetical protein D039_3546A, partial [Vibrio parahaemolyticus EKP-028]
MYVVQRH